MVASYSFLFKFDPESDGPSEGTISQIKTALESIGFELLEAWVLGCLQHPCETLLYVYPKDKCIRVDFYDIEQVVIPLFVKPLFVWDSNELSHIEEIVMICTGHGYIQISNVPKYGIIMT